MPPWVRLPWRLPTAQEEVPTMTVQIAQCMSQRRQSAASSQAHKDEDLPTMVLRLERQLKVHLATIEHKLDKIAAPLTANTQLLEPPPNRRRSNQTLRKCASASVINQNGSQVPALRKASWGSVNAPGASREQLAWREDSDNSSPGVPSPPRSVADAPVPPLGFPNALHTLSDAAEQPPSPLTSRGRSFSQRRGSVASIISSFIENMIREKVIGAHTNRSQHMQDIWQFLEETESSVSAMIYSRFMICLVVINVALAVLQSQQVAPVQDYLADLVHIVFETICFAEVVVRFIVSPHRCAFFLSFFNWVDIISGTMVLFRIATLANWQVRDAPGADELLHCIVPVIWLLKLLRNFEQFHLLCSAFEMAFEALPVLLFTLAVMVLSFAAVIFFVEPRDNIQALPQAIWLTIVTMMTVGYGDAVPSTTAGRLVVATLMICSQLYMAIPLGIVGGSFSRVWNDRDRLLILRRTRLRLHQWGYTPNDVVELFFYYDARKTGELDLQSFLQMMADMQLGISADRVQRLFKSFDDTNNGAIDHEEFVKAIFPHFSLLSSTPVERTGKTSTTTSGSAAPSDMTVFS